MCKFSWRKQIILVLTLRNLISLFFFLLGNSRLKRILNFHGIKPNESIQELIIRHYKDCFKRRPFLHEILSLKNSHNLQPRLHPPLDAAFHHTRVINYVWDTELPSRDKEFFHLLYHLQWRWDHLQLLPKYCPNLPVSKRHISESSQLLLQRLKHFGSCFFSIF